MDDDNANVGRLLRKRARKEPKTINPTYEYYSTSEQGFYEQSSLSDKQNIAIIESAYMQLNIHEVPLRFQIIQSNMDMKTKCVSLAKLDHMSDLDPTSVDYYKLWSNISSLLSVPFGKYDSPEKSRDNFTFIETIRRNLEVDIFGHKESKERIVRTIAQWVASPAGFTGISIGIRGGPGGGKTLLCKSIAKALNLPLEFISLGSASGEGSSYLVGHGHTYIGSKYGKILECLIHSKCMNPVICMDELDKVSDSSKGNEIINTLIHLTDATQNQHFNDVYFSDTSFDLSKCIMLFTFNKIDTIDPILLDRMVVIDAPDYDSTTKTSIAQIHMIPQILQKYAFNKTDIVFTAQVLRHIQTVIPKEGGVRSLRRSLDDIVSHLNLERMISPQFRIPVMVDEDMIHKFVIVGNTHPECMSMYN